MKAIIKSLLLGTVFLNECLASDDESSNRSLSVSPSGSAQDLRDARDLQQANNEILRLRAEVERANKIIPAEKTKRKAAEAAIERLRAEYRELEEQCEDLDGIRTTVERWQAEYQIPRKKGAFDEAFRELAKLRAENPILLAQIRTMEAKMHQRASAADPNDEALEIGLLVPGLKNENAKLRGRIDSLEEEVAELRNDLDVDKGIVRKIATESEQKEIYFREKREEHLEEIKAHRADNDKHHAIIRFQRDMISKGFAELSRALQCEIEQIPFGEIEFEQMVERGSAHLQLTNAKVSAFLDKQAEAKRDFEAKTAEIEREAREAKERATELNEELQLLKKAHDLRIPAQEHKAALHRLVLADQRIAEMVEELNNRPTVDQLVEIRRERDARPNITIAQLEEIRNQRDTRPDITIAEHDELREAIRVLVAERNNFRDVVVPGLRGERDARPNTTLALYAQLQQELANEQDAAAGTRHEATTRRLAEMTAAHDRFRDVVVPGLQQQVAALQAQALLDQAQIAGIAPLNAQIAALQAQAALDAAAVLAAQQQAAQDAATIAGIPGQLAPLNAQIAALQAQAGLDAAAVLAAQQQAAQDAATIAALQAQAGLVPGLQQQVAELTALLQQAWQAKGAGRL